MSLRERTIGRSSRCIGLAVSLVWLGGCATAPAPVAEQGPDASDWQAVTLPGKRASHYEVSRWQGRWAIAATADASASMWRRRVAVAPEQIGRVRVSWWVDRLIDGASVADADREDAVARVIFAFDGDRARLSARNQALFDLAQALTGEAPPYATLMYVYDAAAEPGTVVINPRSDRVRKIVLDSGSAKLRTWRDHERNLVEDYRRAFGEDPGPLVGIAVMTDGDNTRSQARTWYGWVELQPPTVATPR
jgi:hypothetical protein